MMPVSRIVETDPAKTLDATVDLANESIALIAHDAMKACMPALVEQHFESSIHQADDNDHRSKLDG